MSIISRFWGYSVLFPLGFIFCAFNHDHLLLNQEFLGMIISSFLISIWLGSEFQLPALGFTVFTFSFLASLSFLYLPVQDWQVLEALSSYGWFITIVFIVTLLPFRELPKVELGLGALCFLTSLYIAIEHFIMGKEVFFSCAWLNNNSMDTSMIVVLLPFLTHKIKDLDYRVKLAIFAVPAFTLLFVTESSTAFGALIVLGFTSFLFNMWMIIPIMLGVIGVLFQHKHFFETSGRFHIWVISMKYWWQNLNIWLGSGSGTFQRLAPMIQIPNEKPIPTEIPGVVHFALFPFMHNEYLQILFEQGILGFSTFMAFSASLLNKARLKPHVFSSLSVLGFVMLTQFPLRYFAGSLVAGFIARLALDK